MRSIGLGLMLLLAAAEARAQDGVLVMDLEREAGDATLARHLGTAMRDAAAQVPGWRLEPHGPTQAQAMEASACETLDAACLGRIALAHEAERIIFGRVAPLGAGQ